MTIEDRTSFETSKRLKELGFDALSDYHWCVIPPEIPELLEQHHSFSIRNFGVAKSYSSFQLLLALQKYGDDSNLEINPNSFGVNNHDYGQAYEQHENPTEALGLALIKILEESK